MTSTAWSIHKWASINVPSITRLLRVYGHIYYYLCSNLLIISISFTEIKTQSWILGRMYLCRTVKLSLFPAMKDPFNLQRKLSWSTWDEFQIMSAQFYCVQVECLENNAYRIWWNNIPFFCLLCHFCKM